MRVKRNQPFHHFLLGVTIQCAGFLRLDSSFRSRSVVEVKVMQTQRMPDVFQIPIDIAIRASGGNKGFVAWQISRSQNYEFLVDGQVDHLDFDPDNWILKKVRATN
jgi:hypothetical protein